MLYGLAMPIVFPITLFALINFYITEKAVLAYFHKKPPNYDNKMMLRAFRFFRTLFFTSFAFTYFFIGIPTLFDNNVMSFSCLNTPVNYPHLLKNVWDSSYPQLMSWIVFLQMSSVYFISNFCIRLRIYRRLKKINEDFEDLSLDIQPFFECISGLEQKKWYAMALHQQQQLHLATMEPNQLELLRTSNLMSRKVVINGIPNYEITSND